MQKYKYVKIQFNYENRIMNRNQFLTELWLDCTILHNWHDREIQIHVIYFSVVQQTHQIFQFIVKKNEHQLTKMQFWQSYWHIKNVWNDFFEFFYIDTTRLCNCKQLAWSWNSNTCNIFFFCSTNMPNLLIICFSTNVVFTHFVTITLLLNPTKSVIIIYWSKKWWYFWIVWL